MPTPDPFHGDTERDVTRDDLKQRALSIDPVTFHPFPNDFDRRSFPEWIVDVTPESESADGLLIVGSERTALYDGGMAFRAHDTINHINDALKGRPLDYVLVSHSHYDHVGVLPYVLNAHPEAQVIGSAYARHVFGRPGALREMARLGRVALEAGGASATNPLKADEISAEGLRVDVIASDGDRFDLGNRNVMCLETKGHTDCGLSFAIEPDRVLIPSESTGECAGPGSNVTAILKSYQDAMASAQKCRAYGARQVISPHLGITPEWYAEQYFDDFEQAARDERAYMMGLFERGLNFDEMLADAVENVWPSARGIGQNWDGFVANFTAMTNVYEREFEHEQP